MSEENKRPLVPSSGSGLFDQIGLRLRLIVRLLKDRRVHPLLKLMPLGSIIYMLVPDLAPGPLDDAAILWIGTYLFVELCPPEVVEEHRLALESILEGEWREVEESEADPQLGDRG